MDEALANLGVKLDLTRAMLTFSLILTRVLTVVTVAPFLGGKQAPPEVKMGIGIAFAILLMPLVIQYQTGPIPIDPINYFLMVVKEAWVGFMLGFIAAELFYAVDMAGRIIDLARGTNQVQLMIPQLGERSSAFGDLFYQLLLVIFMFLDGHHVFIAAMFESFRVVPLDAFPNLSLGLWPLTEMFIRYSADIFTIGVTISAPVAIACLITEMSFGLLNRVAPQINAYFMAMPAKVFVGGVMFLVALPMLLELLAEMSASMLLLGQKLLILLP
ncbi:MAG: flagellar biosynthetic protein FliR [Myxococcota bacterium]